MPDKFLTVDFCCNDGGNGAFRGCFDGIQVENSKSDILEGDCLMFDAELVPSLEFEDKAIVVDGVRYPKRGRTSGVGNWCWDSVQMTVGDIKALLRQLRESGWWFDDCEEFAELEDVIGELCE